MVLMEGLGDKYAFKGVSLVQAGLGREMPTLIFNYDDLWDGSVDTGTYWTENAGTASEGRGAIKANSADCDLWTSIDLKALAIRFHCNRIQFFASTHAMNIRVDSPAGSGASSNGKISLTNNGANREILVECSAIAGQAPTGERDASSSASSAMITLKFSSDYNTITVNTFGDEYSLHSGNGGGSASSELFIDGNTIDISGWTAVRLEILRDLPTIAGLGSKSSAIVGPIIFLRTPLNYRPGLYADQGV